MGTQLHNIWMDSSALAGTPDQARWEGAVRQTLHALYLEPPCRTGRAIITAIGVANRKVTIVPRPAWKKPFQPSGDDANAEADAVDQVSASKQGTSVGPGETGTGLGSDSVLEVDPADFLPPTETVSLKVADEMILHELVHALRQMTGLSDMSDIQAPLAFLNRGYGSQVEMMTQTTATQPNSQSQLYDAYEEFAAILITNIYRSENQRIGLRRDHHSYLPLTFPMTNARTFFQVWRRQIRQLRSDMPTVCNELARIAEAHFNPVRELYMAEVWKPGENPQ